MMTIQKLIELERTPLINDKGEYVFLGDPLQEEAEEKEVVELELSYSLIQMLLSKKKVKLEEENRILVFKMLEE